MQMAVMVFKRSAFETRKKQKAVLKPKQQANVKEIVQVLWNFDLYLWNYC